MRPLNRRHWLAVAVGAGATGQPKSKLVLPSDQPDEFHLKLMWYNPAPAINQRDDQLWEAHFELAALLEQKQDWNGSRIELERAVALSPQQAAAYYRLARVYDRLELPVKAAEARKKDAGLVAGEKLKNGMAVNE